jgi:hypothetical protein
MNHEDNPTETYKELTLEDLTKKYTRRNFLKTTILGLGTGITSYIGLDLGINKISNHIIQTVKLAEEEISELNLNLHTLYRKIEEDIEIEKGTLDNNYQKVKEILTARPFKDIQHETEININDIEQLIINLEKIESHYSFKEKVEIFIDKINKKLVTLDQKVEKYYPNILKKGNDFLRDKSKQISGEERKDYSNNLSKKLDDLCQIYNTNESQQIAETKILEKLNNELRTIEKLDYKEKQILLFLRNEYLKQGDKSHLKEFITNYNDYNLNQEQKMTLLSLKSYLTNMQEINSQIKSDKKFLLELQDNLKQGINLKEEIRKIKTQDYSKQIKEFDSQISKINTNYESILTEIKKKQIEVKNKEEKIKSGQYSNMLKESFDPIKKYLPIGLATVLGSATIILHEKYTGQIQTKAYKSAAKEAIQSYNNLAKLYNKNNLKE